MEPNRLPRNTAVKSFTERAVEIDYISVPHQHILYVDITGYTSGCDTTYPFDPRNMTLISDIEEAQS